MTDELKGWEEDVSVNFGNRVSLLFIPVVSQCFSKTCPFVLGTTLVSSNSALCPVIPWCSATTNCIQLYTIVRTRLTPGSLKQCTVRAMFRWLAEFAIRASHAKLILCELQSRSGESKLTVQLDDTTNFIYLRKSKLSIRNSVTFTRCVRFTRISTMFIRMWEEDRGKFDVRNFLLDSLHNRTWYLHWYGFTSTGSSCRYRGGSFAIYSWFCVQYIGCVTLNVTSTGKRSFLIFLVCNVLCTVKY